MSKTPVKVVYLDERCRLSRATEGAMCFDAVARITEPLVIQSGAIAKIPLGVCVDTGHYTLGVFIASRSGLSSREGLMIVNGIGIIDSDYRGEMHAVFFNTGVTGDYIIQPFERVAQVLFMKAEDVDLIVVDELNNTARGSSGFGSTGLENIAI